MSHAVALNSTKLLRSRAEEDSLKAACKTIIVEEKEQEKKIRRILEKLKNSILNN